MDSKWWVVTAALFVSLSGCISDAPGADPEPEPTDSLDGGNETVAAPVVNNTAPAASLEASALNGTAPLNVTLTVDGSDADGDNLTWVLTLGNDTVADGDALPASVNQTLDAGNHTFVLVVSDGNATGNATVLVTVAAAAEEVVDEVGDGVCHADPSEYDEIPPVGGGILYRADFSWIYEETNGIPGLQWSAEPSTLGENHSKGEGCVNGDTILF